MIKRTNISNQTRWSVLSRDRFTCRYCSRSAPEVELHIDHVKPVSKGGTNDIENLVAACVDCNSGKSDLEIDRVPAVASKRGGSVKHSLTGMAFLSFKDGRVFEQGLITAVFEDGGRSLASVIYFEWLMGEPTYQRLIPVSVLVLNAAPITYRLFENNDARNNYYEWKTHGGGKFEEGAT